MVSNKNYKSQFLLVFSQIFFLQKHFSHHFPQIQRYCGYLRVKSKEKMHKTFDSEEYESHVLSSHSRYCIIFIKILYFCKKKNRFPLHTGLIDCPYSDNLYRYLRQCSSKIIIMLALFDALLNAAQLSKFFNFPFQFRRGVVIISSQFLISMYIALNIV